MFLSRVPLSSIITKCCATAPGEATINAAALSRVSKYHAASTTRAIATGSQLNRGHPPRVRSAFRILRIVWLSDASHIKRPVTRRVRGGVNVKQTNLNVAFTAKQECPILRTAQPTQRMTRIRGNVFPSPIRTITVGFGFEPNPPFARGDAGRGLDACASYRR